MGKYKTLIERYCITHGNSVFVPPYRSDKSMYFCSRQCRSEYMAQKRLSEISWEPASTVASYLAGILDGEGSISIIGRRQKNCKIKYAYLSAQIINTDLNLLDFIKEHLPTTMGTQYIHNGRTNRVRMNKECYRLIYTHYRAIVFLTPLIPYMVIKKEQALLGVEFQSLPLDERRFDAQGLDYAHRMRVLNGTAERYPVSL